MGAHFTLQFEREKRTVSVSLKEHGDTAWLLSISTRVARPASHGPPTVVVRVNGRPLVDPVAPRLSYRVARYLHDHLSA